MPTQDLYARVNQRIAERKGIALPPEALGASQPTEASTTEAPASETATKGPLPEWGTEGPVGVMNAVGTGVNEAFFNAKDMFLGEPAEEDKSEYRRQNEAAKAQLRESGIVNNLSMDITQFAAGLIGVGKLMAPIKVTSGAGRFAWEAVRGSIAAYTVLDPHEERLSDLIQQYEPLRNPITEYLASDPNDPTYVSRFKNAVEDLGLGVLAAGVMETSLRTIKLMKAGDQAGVAAAQKELEEARALWDADKAAREAVEGAPVTTLADDLAQASEGINGRTAPRSASIKPPSGERRVADIELDPEAPRVDPDVPATIEPIPSEGSAIPLRPKDQTYSPSVVVDENNIKSIITTARQDAEAAARFGSREAAIQAGAVSRTPSLPWQKLNSTEDVEALFGAFARTIRTELDEAKGGNVLTDADLNQKVSEIAKHFDAAPDIVMAEISKSGARANLMLADMEAAHIISKKMLLESHALAVKITAGMLEDFGGNLSLAHKELARRMTASADMLAQGQAMSTAFGRGLRRQRKEFAVRAEDIAKFKDIPPDRLADILASTGGDMAKLRQVANPSFTRRVLDEGAFLLTNNLLWNWVTHTVNLSTNLYMLAARPAEKMLGSLMMGTSGSATRRQAMKEYAYMAYSVSDAWSGLVDAFLKADSKLLPYQTEHFAAGLRVNQPQLGLVPIKDTWDLFRNGLIAANYEQTAKVAAKAGLAAYRTGVGLPTRSLGAIDEFIKQLRYRSVVQARASVEGADKGLSGADLKAYVSERLGMAFSPDGRGIDGDALHEAQTTTFQQDLLEGTIGRGVQNFRAEHPVVNFILPFVKTPVNVLRYATKMTPGLNLLQKEYRQMLGGKLGAEAQAHAIGQMALGTTFLGTAGLLALSGRLTGGGPRDSNAKKQLMATGWQPYSIMLDGADGTKTYFPIGRFDPLGLPFGIVADLVDMLNVAPGSKKTEASILAAGVSLSKAFSEKTFLMNINQAMEMMTNPGEDGEGIKRFFGNLAGNMIPGSSAIRVYANQDPYLREARTFLDRVMSDLPGYSEKLPPQRDAFGDPIWRKRGLTTDSDVDVVETEHARLIMDTGQGIRPPQTTYNGVDLRDVTLPDGLNAYDVLQQMAAQPTPNLPSLKEALATLIKSETYSKLVDGSSEAQGTKSAAFSDIVEKYRAAGKAALLQKYPELRIKLSERQMDVLGRLRAKQEASASGKTESERPTVRGLLESMGY